MKSQTVLIFGLILTLLGLQFYRIKEHLKPFSELEWGVYDAMIRNKAKAPESGAVAIVDVDEASIDAYGQWPWSRYRLAQLVKRLEAEGAKVIAFDMVFAEEDRTSPDQLEKIFKSSTVGGIPAGLRNYDRVLADILEMSTVVLGCYLHVSEAPVKATNSRVDPLFKGRVILKGPAGEPPFLLQCNNVTPNLTNFVARANGQGFFNCGADDDGTFRRVPLIYAYGPDRIYPSLGLEALRMYQDKPSNIIVHHKWGEVQRIQVGDLNIPTQHAGQIYLNYCKARGEDRSQQAIKSFDHNYSVKEVLEGTIPEGSLRGKIVFIGTSAPGLRDIRPTPIGKDFTGVEIHATLIDNILSGDVQTRLQAEFAINFIFIAIVGLFLTWLISRRKALLSLLVFVGLVVFLLVGTMVLFNSTGLMFNPTWILLCASMNYVGLTTLRYWLKEKDFTLIQSQFSNQVSEGVMNYLLDNPDSITAAGTNQEVSVFFSDLEGFTSLAENITPATVSLLMKHYFTPMANLIITRDGYVDKFIGDSIMAVWGAPKPSTVHAVHACLTGLEQRRMLPQLQKVLRLQFDVEVEFRIGINTGTVMAGWIGSDKRSNYTVMGDIVNMAARFEPLNKEYGTRIIIGAHTYEAAKDEIEARMLDRNILKGRVEPVVFYELLERKGRLDESMLQVVKYYEDGLQAAWALEWKKAVRCFEQALNIKPDDAPSLRFARIARAKLNEDPKAEPLNHPGFASAHST
ncbi:MAG: adenylate cyclase [Candidatus Omnitrophota bacterium]|jgi:adenylate cyclase